MPNFDNLNDVKTLLSEAQEAEEDNRSEIREVTHFLQKSDGQWEPSIVQKMSGRPRYTFDKCNPIVDAIAGEMEQAEFGIKVRPITGDASKDTASILNGLIRSIQNNSNAKHVFNSAGRKMVSSGFDAWRVTHDWGDTDSFEQDLFIRKIANAVDRVWFDPGAEMQDMSDAQWAFVLQALTKNEYNERFPEGSGQSVGDSRSADVYYYKADYVIVGEFIWKEPITKELVLMSNNAVYEADDKFNQIVDELAQQGINEIRRRKRKSHKVVTRLFDGSVWLTKKQDTVFDYIPVIPVYANFDISENKVIYRGAVNNLMDAQRVYNYAQSRATEEGALAPRAKYWMTREQAQSDLKTLQTMNTNADPVQLYTHVDGHASPYWSGGAQINAGLQQTAADMANNIVQSSGIFAANQGNSPNQSGYAIELQQNKGDNSTIKYFNSMEIGICQTARVIIGAIPKVFDTKRTVRILGEDGSSKMETINDRIYDEQTSEWVEINDLRKGKYDVVCEVGPAFKSRQQETARAFLDAANLDPSLLTEAGDIWLMNLNVPGFDAIAERKRKRLLEAGAIPDSQMTDEEKKAAQAIIDAANANPPQPDPMAISIMEQTQANTANVMSMAQDRQIKAQLSAEKLRIEEQDKAVRAAQNQQKIDLDAQNQQFEQMKAIAQDLKTQAETLKIIKEAIGANTIIGDTNTEAYKNQAEIVVDKQESGMNQVNIP